MPGPNPLAGGDLDRVAARRGDADWVAALLADGASRVLPVRPPEGPVVDGDRLGWLPAPDVDLAAHPAEALLLGLDADGVAWFAVDAGDPAGGLDPTAAGGPVDLVPLPAGGAWTDVRMVASLLGQAEGSRLAQALGLVNWHRTHRFCGRCGGPTVPRDAGYVRACQVEACAAQHFPRTDPAVIMLVTLGDRALLGRQALWPAGRVSALAGFVEPGESLEDAVAREVFEEVGVRVRDVRYRSSQPWPFPQSLMLGFRAEADDDALTLDHTEIAEARWYSRDELRAAVRDGDVVLPPPVSIAASLVGEWLASAPAQ
ncbi:MAG: pyrophosphatase [Acidimicrobiales bacterium]|jgi:NAD+ diphosphatase|nr:pyrophosphatase [Acidimicrobiales bacterium]